MILCTSAVDRNVLRQNLDFGKPLSEKKDPSWNPQDMPAYKKFLKLPTTTESCSNCEKNGKTQSGEEKTMAKDDPKLKKYRKMLKMRVPEVAVRQKMKKDGLDPSLLFGGSDKKPPDAESKFRNSKIWQSIMDFDAFPLDFSLDLFEDTNSHSTTAPRKKKSKKAKAICLIENPKIAQRIHLMVGSLKQKNKTLLDVQRGIWSLGDLPVPFESFLHLNLSPDIIATAETYHGAFSELDNASKFIFALQNIPNFHRRLELWSFARTFGDQIESTSSQIELCTKAFTQIQENKKLHIMFNLCCRVLQLSDKKSNYEHGFPLHKLYTLSRKKLAKNDQTLLQHICTMNVQNAREFTEELDFLKDTVKALDLDLLGGMVDSIMKRLQNCAKDLENYSHPQPDRRCRDRFVSYFTDFLNAACPVAAELSESYNRLMELAKKVTADLGEPLKVEGKINTRFILSISKFVEETKKAILLNEACDARNRRKSISRKASSKKLL